MVDRIEEIEYNIKECFLSVDRSRIDSEHVREALESLLIFLGEVGELESLAEKGYLKALKSAIDLCEKKGERLIIKYCEVSCFEEKALFTRARSLNFNLKAAVSAIQTDLKFFEG